MIVVRNRRNDRGSMLAPSWSRSEGMTKSGASYSMCRSASAGASTDMHLVWGLVSKIMGYAADRAAIAMTATTVNACRIGMAMVPIVRDLSLEVDTNVK